MKHWTKVAAFIKKSMGNSTLLWLVQKKNRLEKLPFIEINDKYFFCPLYFFVIPEKWWRKKKKRGNYEVFWFSSKRNNLKKQIPLKIFFSFFLRSCNNSKKKEKKGKKKKKKHLAKNLLLMMILNLQALKSYPVANSCILSSGKWSNPGHFFKVSR